MLAQEVLRRTVHLRHGQQLPADVDRTTRPGVEAPAVADEVLVAPVQRGEPGVESGRRHIGRTDAHVVRKDGVEPAGCCLCAGPGRPGKVDVAHLTERVNPGVGAAGDHHSRLRHSQHPLDGCGEFTLHCAQSGLRGPPVEAPAVIGEVEPDAQVHDTEL